MSLRWGNESLFETIEKELPQSTFYWLMISICLSITWVVYITYYNSRVLGLILTTILNHFIKHGHIKFGSFSISVLSGKIMFRDMHWITEDFSVRVQLGLAIFRWWRPLTLKEITEDLSHSETRLSVYLDSFEWHIYNSSSTYGDLETLFGLEPTIKQQQQQQQQQQQSETNTNSGSVNVKSKWQWRDLIPVIKVDISSGRIVFGNYHMSTTLSANFGDTHMVYTTKPASTPFDKFMHVLTCKMENLRVMFVPSPGSKTPEDEPPRYMGDGFVVLHSNNADIYYYYDEPGVVPHKPEMVQLANGDVVARRTWPCWGMDVKCGKGTDISYGPWADRQREKLHRFFFPPNYKPLEATVLPSPGEVRMCKCFDFKMSVQAECTIDILFTKDKETQAIHMNTQAGSYLDAMVPYIMETDGYTTKVNGQLMNVDATSSLQFRSFLECETLQFDIETMYPKRWNDHQKWRLDLTACKSTLYLIFDHKYFFADLVNDWSSKSRDDLYRFVPYTWRVCFLLKQFELITLANEYNWIDCFGQTPENAHIAVCGDTLDMSFVLPFEDFLPPTVSMPIIFKGESAVLSLYVPEKSTSRHALLSIARTMKIVGRDGKELSQPFGSAQSGGMWRRTTQKSKGWVDCMEAPSVAINLNYTYHPMPLLEDGETNHVEPIVTHGSEERILETPHLIPLRPLRPRKKQPSGISVEEFDASKLEADVISVGVEIAPSVLCAYGSLICNVLHLKENYLGEDSKFTDYESAGATKDSSVFEHVNSVATKLETFDPRVYRPFEVKVEVTLHDIQAHLVKNCKPDDPPCPWVYVERLSVEVVKKYEETKVQVLVSPAYLLASDRIKRPLPHAHLQDGHMCLSGLQIRGHAMFSHEGLPIDSETLEYAWLVEITVGTLTGRVTAPQLHMIVESLEQFVFLVEDAENSLQRPAISEPLCHHKVTQVSCTQARHFPCPMSDDLRYTMTRVTVDGINLYLVEAGSALSLQLYPIRLSTCNLHGQNNKAGITVLVPHIKVNQFVLSLPTMHQYNGDTDVWLESGSVSLGPITVNAAMALENSNLRNIQDVFLKRHDRRSRRLNFLWPHEDGATLTGKCGCVGGCMFFGNPRNGTMVFQPSDGDTQHGLNCVMYHQQDENMETVLGFGQSILHPGEFIFYTPGIPSSEDTLRACRHADDIPDGTTARSSVTLVEHDSVRSVQCLSSESPGSSTSSSEDVSIWTAADEERHRHSSHAVDKGIYRDKLKSSMSPANRPLSDGLRESCDVGSVFYGDVFTPITEPVTISRTSKVVNGDDILSSGSSPTRQGILAHGSPATVCRHDSFSSMHSLTTSQRSSLASPILQRLSSQTSIQKGSSPSMAGSEKYFSCTEDADILSNRGNDSIGGLSDYQGATPGNQSSSFWFSRDDDPVTHTVIMTSHDSDDDNSDDSSGSFVSASSSSHRKRRRKVVPQHGEVVTPREQSSFSESHLASESDDITPLLNETPTQETTNITDYVNLHNQISQPITRSPILISSYVNHMTQLKCTHWTALAPVPHLLSNTSNTHNTRFHSSASTVVPPNTQNSSLLIPQFVVVQPGFTSVKMTAKKESNVIFRMPSDSTDSEKEVSTEGEKTTGINDDFSEIDGFMKTEDSISNTTAIVNLKGPIDVMISPLLLETLQRYVEAVIPALATLHVSSVVDLLHRRVSAATSYNKILDGDDMENDVSLDDIKDADLHERVCVPRRPHKGAGNLTSEQGNRTNRVQVMFSISKVNVRMLQMSLVEEVVSFSALDRIKELMCVSVFCACLDSITFTLLANNQLEKSSEPICKIAADAKTTKHVREPTSNDHLRGSKKVAPAPCKLREKPSKVQSSEQNTKQQKEDSVGSLNIARIHFQLRRLRQKSNLPNSHVILTTIPEHRSKVTFTFPSEDPGARDVEDIIGFIMFECGLEEIDLKCMWRWGYSPTPTMEDSLHLQQAETLLQDAQRKVTFYNEASEDLNEDSAAERVQRQHSNQNTKKTKPTTIPGSKKTQDKCGGFDNLNPETEQSDGEDEVDGDQKLDVLCAPLDGNASNCELQFQTVWFNFAAPPSKKRNTESTRLDWNLLSTAAPAIKAWMNPAHHLTVAVTDLLKKYKYRLNTVMACVMVEALEVQGIHVPAKGKYNRLTSRSRALQVDPSCQLMTVLRRYLAQVDLADIEASINSNSIPQFITIQKGLLALTRQWKNVLYLPRNDFRSAEKLPYTFTFAAIPPGSAVDVAKDDTTFDADVAIGDDALDTISDSYEVVDENMSLLKAEGGSFHTAQSAVQESVSRVQHHAAAEKSRNGSGPNDAPIRYVASTNKLMPTLSNPVTTKETPGAASEPQQGRATMGMRLGSFLGVTSLQSHLTRNESYMSVQSVCSASGGSSVDGLVPDPTPGRASFAQHLSRLDQRAEDTDDLYRWMQRQQDFTKTTYYPAAGGMPETFTKHKGSEQSIDELPSENSLAATFVTTALQPVAAQVLFKPLLTTLGLHIDAVKRSALMKKFGGNVSIKGALNALRIDIIESEEVFWTPRTSGKGGTRTRTRKTAHFSTDAPTPALLFDNFTITAAMKDNIDLQKVVPVPASMPSRNVGRHSLRSVKLAMDHMEAKPTTTKVYFDVYCQSIMQHVNVPLLRLIHQFVTMIETISDTHHQLREVSSQTKEADYRRHTKSDSKGSSSSTETTSPSVQSGTPIGSSLSPQYSEGAIVDSMNNQPHRPDQLSLQSPGSRSAAKSSYPSSKAESAVHSPLHSYTESVMVASGELSSPAVAERTIVDEITENTPKCWHTLYHLLELYSIMPETNTIDPRSSQSRLSIIDEESDVTPVVTSEWRENKMDAMEQLERQVDGKKAPQRNTITRSTFMQSIIIGERVPLIIFGTAKVKRVHISAVLSGLKLEAEVRNVHASATHKERVKGVMKKKSHESSVTAHVGQSMIVIREGVPPDIQTVVTVNIGQSQGLYSTFCKEAKEHNSGLVTIGVIAIDIPQHPVALHGVVYRSSKRLSCTLQEFIRPPGKVRPQESEGSLLSQQPSRHSELSEFTSNTTVPSLVSKLPQKPVEDKLIAPSVVHFKAVLRGLVLSASLLPSLRARYKMEEVLCSGITGRKPKCTIDLPAHSLSFTSKVTIPSSLPSSANINLPRVQIHGDYRQHNVASTLPDAGGLMEGHHLRAGHYLQATAEVGMFEHSLTTDLLNHLVFVQKVFMKEVNELVQKVSGGDQPVSLFGDLSPKSNLARRIEPLLYSVSLRLKGIQITATTPTSIAVRLETTVIDLDLTNRVVNNRYCAPNDSGATYVEPGGSTHKLFVKMQVDLNLALGTLLKNPMFEEAEAEFQHLASFATRFGLRNALQDEMIPDMNKDQEALLISLTRPVIYVQPVSFDKAVLVWLNYKNAYEYWNEQRAALNKEVQTATMQVFEKFTGHAPVTPSVAMPATNSTLFLQVTASDMGMCLPLNSYISPGMLATTNRMIDEPTAATVMTLESTQISVCSFGSMVSKGRFHGFCLRFADDFEVSWDDWKPEKNQDVIMNAMVVPEGTYEICSRTMTVAPDNTKKNIKWMMNINWKMQGLDVHLDTNIGQRLSMLGSTLTSLAREQSDDSTDSQSEGMPKEELETTPATRVTSFNEDLPRFLFENTIDKKTRARLIVDAMNKQAKKVEELRSSTASHMVIEPEERKLTFLETAIFNDFRQDIMKRLNRQVTRATTIKEKLGLSYKPVHHRSKSVGTNIMRELKRSDSDIIESTRHASYTGILRDKQTMSFDINAVATNQRHGRTLSLDTNSLELPLRSLDSASHAQHEFPQHSMRRSSLATPSSSEGFGCEGREAEDNGECAQVSSLPSSLGQGTSSSEELDIFNQENLAFLAERFGTDHASISATYSDTHTSHKRLPVAEPNIDFELDIKLDVDCGKCVLHPKDTDTEVKSGNGKRRDSFSPHVRRRNAPGKKLNTGDIPTIKIHPSAASTSSSTVFILPGVDIRVHYSSKMNHNTPSPDTAYTSLSNPRTPLKKANLYIWLTLQQLSQEMLISPVLLDFMEQALEPIPLPDNKASSSTTSRASESNAINASASSLVATYSSFPVDIIVYFQMESSIVRFTCLPLSRVECLVRLPSLSLIFSTKRSIADDNFNDGSGTDGGTDSDTLNSGCIPDVGHTRRVSGYHTEVTSGGGLSVTGCLNNFSMFIFHPYGGMTKKTSFTSLESTFRKAATGTNRQNIFDATGRKDALSLNVEFIKVNVSRSRKGIIHSDWTPGVATGGVAARPHDTLGTKCHNIVRFSAICDVGFASFNYDMRRLSEILAFPKAWYSRTLARHLFLGEEMGFGVDSTLSDDDNDVIPSFLVTPSTPHGRTQNLIIDGSMHSPMSRSPGLSPWRTTSTTSANRAPSPGDTSPRPSRDSSLAGLLASPHMPSKPIMHWETLVIFAVNLSQLDLTINMSNIMGNTVWTTKDVKSQGELSIDSSGHKNMKILAGLGESKLEAQGGIVGCKIDVQNFWTNLKIKEDPGKEPYHKVGLQLQIVETRLDYMGSSMMMGRMCNLDIVLKDEWRLDRGGSGDDDLQPLATKRPVLIFMHGDLSWDLMHLMISRSTTPDLLRMFTKLDEFFKLHIKSSAHVLSALGPVQKPKPSKRKSDLSERWISRMRHHRHWQKVLSNVSGCKLSMFDFTLPTEGTIAGGTMTLRGNSFSLACFHGINFRCKSWALFSMDEPIVHFATESQEIINDDGETCAHIVQNLSFQLGHNMADLTERKHMATVCLLNRGHHVPPHFTSVQEWFHYAFATNELKDLYRFPEMSHEDATLQVSSSSASVVSERRRRQQELNHDTEIIFVLPSLQMNFKTIHQQGVEEPHEGDPKPLVECSFVTEFEDHIFITMDAESILFIHDLITSYLREKDKDGSESGLRSPYDRHSTVESPTEVLKQDYREYQCHTWVLEPTIRLISWGGKKIDPVGVDFILQKLGFQHARLTIPKWIQRGFMDPLDGILSVLVKQLIKSLKEDQTQSVDGRAESDIM